MIKAVAVGAAIGVAGALVLRQLGRRALATEGAGEEKGETPAVVAALKPQTAPPPPTKLDLTARLTLLGTRKARS